MPEENYHGFLLPDACKSFLAKTAFLIINLCSSASTTVEPAKGILYQIFM